MNFFVFHGDNNLIEINYKVELYEKAYTDFNDIDEFFIIILI